MNITYERYVFNKRFQQEAETVECFLASIRRLVKTCEYCENCVSSIIRDRIVLGIRDPETQHYKLVLIYVKQLRTLILRLAHSDMNLSTRSPESLTNPVVVKGTVNYVAISTQDEERGMPSVWENL